MRSAVGLRRPFARRRERGVALLVAMIVLVIIGLMSASIMRGALSSDLIANNSRVQTLASQVAQVALRYCEDETVAVPQTINILPVAPANAWNTWSNWSNEARMNTVPRDYLESTNSTAVPGTLPQCMVQQMMVGTTVVYQVTARGFSPDYSADEDGNTDTGSVVWLQSIVSL